MLDKKIIDSQRLINVLFILILGLIAFAYNYHNIAFFRPQSTHQWRQADCASIVMNYYQGGMNFIEPQVHNLTSNKGTSGIAFTSETPVYYYSIAILYKLFGPHESIFRVLNTLLFLLGIFYLHKLLLLITNSKFWSLTLPLLFITSPVLIYYGNSFISNPLALSFSIIGLYFFSKFIYFKKFKFFLLFVGLFLFAASLKITAFFSFFAIGAYAFVELIGKKYKNKDSRIFKTPIINIGLMTIPVILIGIWVVYAHIQNTNNKCYYFSTVTFPIWDLGFDEIKAILKQINKVWVNQYFHKSMFMFIAVQFIFTVINFKKLPTFLKWFLPVLLIESLVFVLLQFWTFRDHDYYTIGLFIFPIIITIITFFLLKKHYQKLYNSIFLKGLILALLVFNLYYAKGQLLERYNGWWNNIKDYEDLHTIEPYLREIGIKQTDTVISIPDYSNVSLYLMNQRGWTEHIDREFNKGEKIKFNADSSGIQHSINKGAKYLVMNGIKELYEKPYLVPFCYKKIGNYKKVLVFDLHAKDTNFNLDKKVLKMKLMSNADTLSKDGNYFKMGQQLFEYGNTQSNEESFSGNFSCKLNSQNPYGMTVKLKDINYGDIFKLKVWCKDTQQSNGEIIAQLDGINIIKDNEVIQTKNGWKQIEASLFIQNLNANSELTIFLYNITGSAYFDDFEIIQYGTIIE